MLRRLFSLILFFPLLLSAQINTDRVMMIARNALYFEDYVLSIQYFNQVINAKPYLYEPYFFRGLAKLNLDDYQGAEADCDSALARNPFVVGIYQVRGIARIRQENFQGAIEDYQTALKFDPENEVLWHNLALSHMRQEDYDSALTDLENLLKVSPRYTSAYLMRGEVYLQKKDTVQAYNDFTKVIEMDAYDANGWAARAHLKIKQKKYEEAEKDLDQAIYLSAKNANNYINRALARFHQNNLRGAMSDYDIALDIDPKNFIGHYNRGLLRASVGDDNRAIEDFNFVLSVDPDDMMATFNRGILRAQTGDYAGAIDDYSRVLSVYPDFLAGYYHRLEARKKIGDRVGAQEDDYKIVSIQLDEQNKRMAQNQGKKQAVSKGEEGDDESDSEKTVAEKTRKRSDQNVANYHKIIIADDESSRQYTSEYRGRVQDRKVEVKIEPMYVLSYYEKTHEVRGDVHFHKYIAQINHSQALPKPLRITNREKPLTEEEVKEHFELIDYHSSLILTQPENPLVHFARALDFYLSQDFSSAINDLTHAILADKKGDFYPAYFMRSLIRYKQLVYNRSQEVVSIAPELKEKQEKNFDFDAIVNDLTKVIEIAPDFAYAYYNRGNIYTELKDFRTAILDYDKAIAIDAAFAEAYYNRGLTKIYLGNTAEGIADLSKAGELGIAAAYNVIKRFSK